MKSGFIGIVGRPNVGKSTLLNSILGEKIAITTDKPQTTRNSIRGIYTNLDESGDGVQFIFIDTPGIHKARNKLGSFMTETAISTFREVDVILFLVDDEIDKGHGGQIHNRYAERNRYSQSPCHKQNGYNGPGQIQQNI